MKTRRAVLGDVVRPGGVTALPSRLSTAIKDGKILKVGDKWHIRLLAGRSAARWSI